MQKSDYMITLDDTATGKCRMITLKDTDLTNEVVYNKAIQLLVLSMHRSSEDTIARTVNCGELSEQ